MTASTVGLVAAIIIPIMSMLLVIIVQVKNWRDQEHNETVKLENRMTRVETKLEGVNSTLNRLERRRA